MDLGFRRLSKEGDTEGVVKHWIRKIEQVQKREKGKDKF